MAQGFSQWGNDLYTGRRSYNIVGRSKWFYAVSITLCVLSLLVMWQKGFNLGIDFRGGSEFQISNASTTAQQPAIDAVHSVSPTEEPLVSTVGASGLRVQTEKLGSNDIKAVQDALAKAYDVPANQVTSSFIGPTWGADVSQKALNSLVVFLVLLAVVMTAYFRNWRMAVAAILALFHDLIITVGIYALVGWEVTPSTVIGFLTILGYSIYDTVVVFDKVRENTASVFDQTRSTYSEQANLAINQTLVRSINTSVVALLPVSAILFIGAFVLGAGTLRDIALALFIGMAVGAYSSIFLATPMEVTLRNREAKIKAHTASVVERREKEAAQAAAEGGDEATVAAIAAGLSDQRQLVPGSHQGQRAQPRRKKRSER